MPAPFIIMHKIGFVALGIALTGAGLYAIGATYHDATCMHAPA